MFCLQTQYLRIQFVNFMALSFELASACLKATFEGVVGGLEILNSRNRGTLLFNQSVFLGL